MILSTVHWLFRELSGLKRALLLGAAASLVGSAFAVAAPLVLRAAIDRMTGRGLESAAMLQTLAALAAVIALLALGEGVFRFSARWLLVSQARVQEHAVRERLVRHLLGLPLPFFHRSPSGDLMARLTNDPSSLQHLIGVGMLGLSNTALVFVLSVAMMAVLSPPLALMVLVPFPLIAVMINRVGKSVYARFRAVQDHYGVLTDRVQENLSGIRVVKAMVRERAEEEEFAALSGEYMRRSLSLTRAQAAVIPGIGLLAGLGLGSILYVGGRMVISGSLTLGTFVAFNAYLAMLVWPAVSLGWVLNLVQRAAASLERIREVEAEAAEETGGGGEPFRQGDIDVSHLTFAYPGAASCALSDVSLSIPAGKTIGLVGPTGSGKTTLVRLLLRLYDVPSGSIRVGETDLGRISRSSLRAEAAVVSQEPFLYSDTLAANISFGREDAGPEEIEEAAFLAGLKPDLETFPRGLETVVGERGVTLSGGQRQRAALARALVRRPRLLILDDPFSALDAETEEAILVRLREEVGRLKAPGNGGEKGTTVILIAHRVSAVRDCDWICVFDGGRIAARGTHEELLGRDGFYRDMARRQQIEENLGIRD
ncbi:MAG: ABC transporter ATP-binding protein [Nitrospirae bacterium]|nr:ABC transporter ATP-binding protein [Nitrospirota bacterium]